MPTDGIKVYSYTPFTLIDYPDRPAAIVWLAGCNMRCPYCHNPDIVFGKNGLDFSVVSSFLQKRKKVLEGVVISGGEPTLHPDLEKICIRIKKMGYKIKLDTNGTGVHVVENLASKGLIDYVAVDIKASPTKYAAVSGKDTFTETIETIKTAMKYDLDIEARTTLHSSLLNLGDIKEIIARLESIGYTGRYYLQNFVDAPKKLDRLPDNNIYEKPIVEASFFVGYRNFG